MDADNQKLWMENSIKYNYLHFLYNATHQQPFCSSPPYQVYIESTNACNLRCSHCPQHTMRRERRQFITLDLFEKIIKGLVPVKPFVEMYLQGEPLVHPKIVDLVAIARRHGLLPRVITNTTLLTKEKSRALIEAGLDKIVFSTLLSHVFT